MSNSPWGKIQSQIQLARGVRWVNTASHGGFLISQRFAQAYLSTAAVSRGMKWGSYLAFEEDSDATIILFETRAFDDQLGYTKNHDQQRLESLSRWHADYLLERNITPTYDGLKFFNENRQADRMRAVKDPDLIVSASGDWKQGVPAGMVEVITAVGTKHLVSSADYAKRNLNLTLLSTMVSVPA